MLFRSLQSIFDWFTITALPAINSAVNWFKDSVLQPAIDLITNIWNTVSPTLQLFLAWFQTDGLPAIVTSLTNFKDNVIQPVIDKISGWWTSIQPGVDSLKNNLKAAWDWIDLFVLTPIRNGIQLVIDKFNELKNALTGGLGAYGGTAQNAQTALNMVNSGQATPGDFMSALIRAIGSEVGIGDYTGMHPANKAYLVGSGAQPQLFAPKSDMMGIPNFDQFMNAMSGGGGMQFHGPITVIANNVTELEAELRAYVQGNG